MVTIGTGTITAVSVTSVVSWWLAILSDLSGHTFYCKCIYWLRHVDAVLIAGVLMTNSWNPLLLFALEAIFPWSPTFNPWSHMPLKPYPQPTTQEALPSTTLCISLPTPPAGLIGQHCQQKQGFPPHSGSHFTQPAARLIGSPTKNGLAHSKNSWL